MRGSVSAEAVAEFGLNTLPETDVVFAFLLDLAGPTGVSADAGSSQRGYRVRWENGPV